MIEEEGTIIESRGASVLIKTQRGSACGSCATKEMCRPTGEDSMIIEAENPIDAQVGNQVVFTVGAATVLKAGMMFYLIPLLSFIAGVVLGQVVTPEYMPGRNPDFVSAILGFGFVALTFLGLRFYGKQAEEKKAYKPTVIRVIQ